MASVSSAQVLSRAVAAFAAVAALAGCSATATPAGGRAGAGGATTAISFNAAYCGRRWQAGPGPHAFLIKNDAGAAAEVNLIDPANYAIYGLLEAIGPQTTGTMAVDLGSGRYAFQCIIEDIDPFTGPVVRIPGHATGTPGIVPVTDNDLLQPEKEYHAYVTTGLNQLVAQTRTLAIDVKDGKITAAKAAWLTAHLTYERLGAAYGTFGDFDGEIDGRADGLPGGVRDPGFTGFYRVEYGLWHGQSAKELTNPVDQLAGFAQSLRNAFPDLEIDLLDIGLRTHEILENAESLRGRRRRGQRPPAGRAVSLPVPGRNLAWLIARDGGGLVRRDRREPVRAHRPAADSDRTGPVPDRRGRTGAGGNRRAAVRLRRARSDGRP